MQFPLTVPPRFGGPAFLRCSTGGRPNTDDSLAFGTARVSLIGLISRRRRTAFGNTASSGDTILNFSELGMVSPELAGAYAKAPFLKPAMSLGMTVVSQPVPGTPYSIFWS